jgi:transcriptional antiterminator RfaH
MVFTEYRGECRNKKSYRKMSANVKSLFKESEELLGLVVTEQVRASGNEGWFCVRTHPRHEHIAAAQLRKESGVEVFLPRIRYQRTTRFGAAWTTEAMFRDYLFARFDLVWGWRRVEHTRAIRGVVRFGDRWPTIPEATIIELRQAMGGEEIRVIEDTLVPGDVVQITGGAMHGLDAVVTRVMPAAQRVAVLLDFLGRQTTVELSRSQLALAAEDMFLKPRFPAQWHATVAK